MVTQGNGSNVIIAGALKSPPWSGQRTCDVGRIHNMFLMVLSCVVKHTKPLVLFVYLSCSSCQGGCSVSSLEAEINY